MWVADAKPSGNLDGYEVGDIVLNINPNLSLSPNGEPMYPDLWFASWICVAIPYDPYKIFKGMEKIFALILFFSLFTETKCLAQDTWVKTYHLNTFSSYNLSKNEGGYNILASFGSEGAMVFQTDENGDSLYYNTYQFAGNNTGQYLGGFIKTYDDGHLIFGTSLPGYRISALKTNADESIAWNKALFCGNDTLKGRCVDAINLPDNNVLVTGYSGCNTGGTAFDLFLAKLNIITGNIIWQHIYNTATYDIGGGQVGYHSLDAVKVLPLVDGYLIVGDYNVNANGTSAYLIKTNFEGVFQWDKYINGTYYVNDAILDTDGNILLTGGGLVTYLVKLNPQVDTIWLKTYYDNTLPAPNKMVAVNNGYIMAGGNGGYAFALKTDTAGNVIWIRSYQNASYIYDVIIEEDGDLVMLGLNDDDYTTVLIKTDSTGYYQGLGTHSTTTVPISVYPNPAANTLSINHQNLPTAQTVELYNLTGQLVLQQALQQNNTTISVAGLQVGVYMLQIKTGNTLAQQKVVVWR